ncbi:MAG: hypothetical protein M3N13_07715 [Candidatus Eremiobacteraeota bacterium]|nr:hypothetical protein [Candidatus Eremiobacteraeota bacterium]
MIILSSVASDHRDYSHRSLLEKLGVKPEYRVCIRGVDQPFADALTGFLMRAPQSAARRMFDLIFVKIVSTRDLAGIASLAAHLEPAAGLWIFHPKGRGASPSDADVRAARLAAGRVDNKISSYTDSHTATKYVIPRTKRSQARPRP